MHGPTACVQGSLEYIQGHGLAGWETQFISGVDGDDGICIRGVILNGVLVSFFL